MSQGRDQPERFGTRPPTPCRCSGMEWAWGQTHWQPILGPGLPWRVPICSGSVSSVCGVGLVISGGFTERPWIVDCGRSWGRGDGNQPYFCPPLPGGSHPRQGLPRVSQLLPQCQITKPHPGWELGGLQWFSGVKWPPLPPGPWLCSARIPPGDLDHPFPSSISLEGGV